MVTTLSSSPSARGTVASASSPPLVRRDMKSIARELPFTALRVEGRIPDALRGTLYRAGPGLYESFGRRVSHSFEADGAISALRLSGERGSARAEGAIRLVESEGLRAERLAGRPLFGARASWPRRLWNGLRLARKNTGNTALMSVRERLFALVESNRPTEIDPETLQTLGESDLGGIGDAFSAHPHRVEARGSTVGFGVEYGPRTRLRLYELPDRGAPVARVLGELTLPRPVLLHDFAVTPTRALFLVSPVRVNLARALLGLIDFAHLVTYRPQDGVEVIVVPLDRVEAATRFAVDPFFQWHFAAARDDGDAIETMFVRHPDFSSFDGLRADGPRSEGRLVRARIEPARRRLHVEERWDRSCEFPRVDPRREGRLDAPVGKVFLTEEHQGERHLAMLDVETGRARMHALSGGLAGSEVVFVPRSPDAPEADGWALSLVYDSTSDRSHVRILDTARWEDEPVAKCHFPEWVPMTFHGLWVGSLLSS